MNAKLSWRTVWVPIHLAFVYLAALALALSGDMVHVRQFLDRNTS